MQAALQEPSDAELDGLRSHFCTRGVDILLRDSGLATRQHAHRESVADHLAAADLVLITGGSPQLLYERTIGTPALAALRAASESGAVIAGCSAGAAVIGAGMVIGKGAHRRSLRTLGVASSNSRGTAFRTLAIEPWLQAFPHCTVLGIPDDAMALVRQGVDLETMGIVLSS